MNELERMINLVISDAQLADGCPAEWLQARGMVVRPTIQKKARRSRPWTQEEDEFYLQNVGRMSYEEIAQALGRTVYGVRVHAKRMGFPAATRVPGYLTAAQVAKVLGVDNHKPPSWIDRGILPGESLPFEGRRVRRVRLLDLKMWMVKPTSWLYFDVRLVKNAHLRRLVELAQARWGDEWWSTRQVADYLHCDTRDVTRQIKLGRLQGVRVDLIGARNPNQRWALWFVRRSDVERLTLPRGKGSGRDLGKWSPRADAFILKAKAEGKSYTEIARMMKWPWSRVAYRAKCLAFLQKQKRWVNTRTDKKSYQHSLGKDMEMAEGMIKELFFREDRENSVPFWERANLRPRDHAKLLKRIKDLEGELATVTGDRDMWQKRARLATQAVDQQYNELSLTIDALKFLLENQTFNWHSVDEEMPDDDIEVLVYSQKNDAFFLAVHRNGVWVESGTHRTLCGVSHWCDPIPPAEEVMI